MRIPRRIQSTTGVLWIALTLAVPGRFLAAQDGADHEAKFNARAVLISARVVYLTTQSYAGATPKLLKEKNPGLDFVADAPSAGPAVLSVKIVGSREFRIAVFGSNTCWGIQEAGRQTGVATFYAKRPGPPSSCTAGSFKDSDFVDQEELWKDRE